MQRGWQYLAVSRGLVFHAITRNQLSIPRTIKLIEAEDIWVSFLRPENDRLGRPKSAQAAWQST
jgi:hypothetical protein